MGRRKPGKNIHGTMTFTEHLEVLRVRILIAISAILVCAVAGYFILPKFLNDVIKPIGKLVFISPTEAFWINIKLSLYIGVVLSMPVVLYQVWRFIESGLKNNERRIAIPLTLVSFVLFLSGGFFGYFIVLPLGLKFLLGFSRESLVPMITANNYISFVVYLLLGFGFIFQLPVITFFMARLGIVSDKFLKDNRRYAIIVIFVIAALLTPPDVFTQLLMALPLLLLYEVSVLVARLFGYKN